MNNYLVFFIFVILVWVLNFFIHRYLMNNWDYYRHLQKNPSPIELGIFIILNPAPTPLHLYWGAVSLVKSVTLKVRNPTLKVKI